MRGLGDTTQGARGTGVMPSPSDGCSRYSTVLGIVVGSGLLNEISSNAVG